MKEIQIKEACRSEADCSSCDMRSSVLFGGLEEHDFALIHQPIDQYVVKAGELLYREGEPGKQMYTIRHGTVKLVNYLADGNQRIVGLLRSADVTGLEMLLGQPYQHNAIALTDTEVCRFPVDLVEKLSAQSPGLHKELMRRWQQALNEANTWLVQLSTGSAKQRVARLVLRLIEDENDATCVLFSREDMGAMLGITTETVSRIIAEWKRKGLLSERSSNCVKCDVEQLQRVAED